MVALDDHDYGQTQIYLTKSLILLRQLGEKWQVIHILEVFARLAAEQEMGGIQSLRLHGARLFGAAESLRGSFGARIMEFQRQSLERGIASLRSQLDESTLAAAWEEGRAMTLDQAIAYALAETSTSLE